MDWILQGQPANRMEARVDWEPPAEDEAGEGVAWASIDAALAERFGQGRYHVTHWPQDAPYGTPSQLAIVVALPGNWLQDGALEAFTAEVEELLGVAGLAVSP